MNSPAGNGVDGGKDAAKIVPAGSDSLIVQRRRADTAFVGARRPCTALLGRRVRELKARDVIAPINGVGFDRQ